MGFWNLKPHPSVTPFRGHITNLFWTDQLTGSKYSNTWAHGGRCHLIHHNSRSQTDIMKANHCDLLCIEASYNFQYLPSKSQFLVNRKALRRKSTPDHRTSKWWKWALCFLTEVHICCRHYDFTAQGLLVWQNLRITRTFKTVHNHGPAQRTKSESMAQKETSGPSSL